MDLARKIIVRSRRARQNLGTGAVCLTKNIKTRVFKSANTEAQRVSRITLVSTPDLSGLVNNAIHLPAPVDTDHFKQYPSLNKQKKALIINKEVTDTELFGLTRCFKQVMVRPPLCLGCQILAS